MERLSSTVFVVEATGFEQHVLQFNNSKSNTPLSWDSNDDGILYCVGTLDTLPITISMSWAMINNSMVMFWTPTSEVVDYRVIEKYFEKYCSPRYNNDTCLAKCNADNFHLCTSYLKNRSIPEEISYTVTQPKKYAKVIG